MSDGPHRDAHGSCRVRAARALREAVALAGVVAIAAIALAVLGIGCPIKFVTGVSCPGCGMTRAWLEALQLHLDRAFAYHPLFWLVPPVLVAAAVQQASASRALRRACAAFMGASLVALVVLWAWRMAVPGDLALFTGAAGAGDVVNVAQPGWLRLLCAI